MPNEIIVTADASGNFHYKLPHDYRVFELPLMTRAARWQLLFRGQPLGDQQSEKIDNYVGDRVGAWNDAVAAQRGIKVKALIDEHQAKIASGEIKVRVGSIRRNLERIDYNPSAFWHQRDLCAAYLDECSDPVYPIRFWCEEGEDIESASPAAIAMLRFLKRLFIEPSLLAIILALEDGGATIDKSGSKPCITQVFLASSKESVRLDVAGKIPPTDVAGNQFSAEAVRSMAEQAKGLPISLDGEIVPRGYIKSARQTDNGLEIEACVITGFDITNAGMKKLLDAGVSIRGDKS